MAATTLKEAVIQALNKAANAFYSPQTLTPEQQEQARANIGAMSAATSSSVPAGTLLPFAGTSVPDGYLLCNGANVSRTDYANLFSVIGTRYGEGDGVTTFTLPNLDGRVLQGTNDTSEVGTYLEPQLPNIYGELSHGGIDYTPSANGAFEHDKPLTATIYYWSGSGGSENAGFSFEASRYNEIYAGDHMQASALVCLPCIKF